MELQKWCQKKDPQHFREKPGKGAKPAAVCGTNVQESHPASTGSLKKTVVVVEKIFTQFIQATHIKDTTYS